MPVFHRATEAADARHPEEALRLFQDVLRQAPDFPPAMRRLGFALVAVGREPEGIALIELAVMRERSAENLISLAQVMAFPAQGKVASPEVRAQALKLAQEAAELFHKEAEAHYHADDGPSYLVLVGQLALLLQQYDTFREAVGSLTGLYPHEMATHYFAAIRAALDEDWAGAEVEIAEAEHLGLPHEAATRFLQSGVHPRANVWRYVRYAEYLLAAWIAGLLVLFLRVYSFLFRRITHGATRLQEVLADRVAAQTYGAAQFEEGLRHVIRRSIEFQFEANREIQGALQLRRALQNVYDLRTETSAALEQAIREAVLRPTTEDDTHPGPQDRLWMVSRLKAKREVDGSGLVWDLFADPIGLMAEMTEQIGARVKAVAGA